MKIFKTQLKHIRYEPDFRQAEREPLKIEEKTPVAFIIVGIIVLIAGLTVLGNV